MRPILFFLPSWLGHVPVPSYGLLMVVGAVLGCLVFAHLARARGYDGGKAFEALAETVVVAILLSKVAGLIIAPPEGPSLFVRFAHTGGIWYFGLIAGVAYFARRGQQLGMRSVEALDLAIPGVAIGHAFGRVGCLLAGCCWGSPASVPWAVTFTSADAHRLVGTPLGVPLHPTQAYEAMSEATLGLLLALLVLRGALRFDGQAILTYGLVYAVMRFFFEMLRSDPRGALGPVSTSQMIALCCIAVSLPFFLAGWRNGRKLAPARLAPAAGRQDARQ